MKKVCPDLGKSDYQEKTLDVRMRSTETESVYNDCRGGKGDWWPQHQPDSLRDTARRFSDGHPSSYQPPPTGLNLSQRKGMVSTKPHFAKPIHQLSLTWTDWNPVTLWAAQVVGLSPVSILKFSGFLFVHNCDDFQSQHISFSSSSISFNEVLKVIFLLCR